MDSAYKKRNQVIFLSAINLPANVTAERYPLTAG